MGTAKFNQSTYNILINTTYKNHNFINHSAKKLNNKFQQQKDSQNFNMMIA